MLRHRLVCVVIVAAFVSSASAQEPKPIRLWLTPAKPPTPALRYQLLPDARLTTSGDAASFYRQALALAEKKGLGAAVQEFNDFPTLPLNEIPKEELQKRLAQYADIYELLDKG